jgi:2-polyprenyl-3-methyl-5-hydroxy-6-metoxy-1,4-benzoquinol methylase
MKESVENNTKNQYLGEFWAEHLGRNLSARELSEIVLTRESQINFFKPFFTGKNCIDIGCGVGYSIKTLERHGLDVDGIEPDPKAVDLVNKWIKRGVCMTGFYEDLSIDKKYDIIWLSHILEHVPKPLSLIEKCYEVSKEGGVLCIMVPDCTNPTTKKESMGNKFHISHFTRDDVVELCKQSNYKILTVQLFKRILNNKRRFHKLLRILKLTIISDFLEPFYPYAKTESNDGFEIRIVLQKIISQENEK